MRCAKINFHFDLKSMADLISEKWVIFAKEHTIASNCLPSLWDAPPYDTPPKIIYMYCILNIFYTVWCSIDENRVIQSEKVHMFLQPSKFKSKEPIDVWTTANIFEHMRLKWYIHCQKPIRMYYVSFLLP